MRFNSITFLVISICATLATVAQEPSRDAGRKPPSELSTPPAQRGALIDRFGTIRKGQLGSPQGERSAGTSGNRRNFGAAPGFNQPLDRRPFVQRFDENGDGRLDAGELAKARAALEGLRARAGSAGLGGSDVLRRDRVDPNAMLKRFDADGDGKLNSEERRIAMAELRRLRHEK